MAYGPALPRATQHVRVQGLEFRVEGSRFRV